MDTQFQNDPIVALTVSRLSQQIEEMNKTAIATYTGQRGDYQRVLTTVKPGTPAPPPPVIPDLMSFDGKGFAAAFSNAISKVMDSIKDGTSTTDLYPKFTDFLTRTTYVPPTGPGPKPQPVNPLGK